MKLLREFASFEYDKKEITEEDGCMVLTGVLQRADTINANGRVYPRNVLVNELRNYQKLIDENRAWGELDHSNEPIVNMKNASHMITKIWMQDNVVYGKVKLIDTPAGSIIKAMIKAGGRPGISSRAVGDLNEQNGVSYVQDNLHIVCWDFVSEPSTPGAFMMKEARDLTSLEIRKIFSKDEQLKNTLNTVLNKAKNL